METATLILERQNWSHNGKKSVDGTASSYGNAYGNGHIVGMAIDIDNSKIYFSKDGTFQNSGDPTSGSTGTGAIGYDVAGLIDSDGGDYFIIIGDGGGSIGPVVQSNFGNPSFAVSSGNTDGNGIGNFEFAPPSGYLSFCTKNLSSSLTTIDDPSEYFQTLLYTGNASARSLTNTGNSDLQPDWIWCKNRSTTNDHVVYDSTRGAQKDLRTNNAEAEGSNSSSVTAFNSDGFSLGGNHANTNNNGSSIVAWQWKANGGTTTSVSASGSGITDILASTHQASTEAGFSIVSWTSVSSEAFVSHGLGAIPHVVLMKDRENGSANWIMYHVSVGSAHAMLLNTTSAKDGSSFFRDSDRATTGIPTSSIFKLGTQDHTGGPTNDMIAYCFAPIQGYSKFGTYTGNADADGPFVYTGFKPAWLLIKNTQASGNSWVLLDNKRQGFNVENDFLFVNANSAESADLSNHGFDFLSNGFKLRGTGQNDDGHKFVYMAFAEQPFVTSTGIPATAR